MAGIDWRDVVKADVEALPESILRVPAGSVAVNVRLKGDVYALLDQAAKKRALLPSSYARRAVLAMLAHEMGVPLAELTAMEPALARDTGYAISTPDPEAFGPWEIATLVAEEVDDDAGDAE